MKKVVFGIVAALLVFGLVLTGCSGGNGDGEEKTGFTLTVAGLPSAAQGKAYGASLMNTSSPTIPVAVGMLSNGTFVFYHPGTNNIPDSTKPFNTAGTYVLAIALTDLTTFQPETIYSYTKGTVNYSSSKAITVQWSDFARQ